MYPTQFCETADGVRIAYAASGDGFPFIKTPNWLCHLELDVTTGARKAWIEKISERFRLIRYDARGCGLSDRDIRSFLFANNYLDLEAVVKACRIDRFILFGASQGGAIAIDYASRHPDQVSHLILYGTYLRGTRKRAKTPEDIERTNLLLKLVQVGWGQPTSAFRQVFANLFIPDSTPEQLLIFDEIQRQTVSAETASRLIESFYDIDVSSQARRVICPTLVMHSRQDALIPVDQSIQVASAIDGAEFVSLESRNHFLLPHEPAWQQFFDEIDAFLQRHRNQYGQLNTAPYKEVTRGHTLIMPDTKKNGDDLHKLSLREVEVLDLIARGMDNDQIAARLSLSKKTVRNHITNIFAKLEIYTRAKAVVVAREAGLGTSPLKS